VKAVCIKWFVGQADVMGLCLRASCLLRSANLAQLADPLEKQTQLEESHSSGTLNNQSLGAGAGNTQPAYLLGSLQSMSNELSICFVSVMLLAACY